MNARGPSSASSLRYAGAKSSSACSKAAASAIPAVSQTMRFAARTESGAFAAIGLDFEGKNNTYFQPPFAQLDLTGRVPVTSFLEAQVSVQNLLNTNNFYNLPAPGAGVTTVVGVKGGGLDQSPSDLIPAPPRTVRVQLRWHTPVVKQ